MRIYLHKFQRISWALMGMLICLSLGAASATLEFPEGCRPLSVQETLTLENNPKQKLILIHNASELMLWLIHSEVTPTPRPWNSHLCQDQWSAVTTNEERFTLKCIEAKPGAEQVIHCLQAIHACIFDEAQFSEENQGSYWVSENQALEDLLKHIKARGISLHKK